MDKKVYLYVTPFFPAPERWKYGYGYDFVKALSGLGVYDVKVFVPWSRGGRDHGGVLSHDDYEIGGIHVHRFHIRQMPSSLFPFAFSKYNRKSFIAAIKSAGIDVDKVAICHLHTAIYGQFAQAIKDVNKTCKTLLHHHDLQSYGLNTGVLRHCWLYNMIQFPILRRMHARIDGHVFVSEAARCSFLAAPDTSWTQFDDYKKQMRWLPYRPVKIKDSIVLHNGVDKSIFYPSTSQSSSSSVAFAKENQTAQTFTIGCVGNFEEWKDPETLIRAVGLIDKPIHVVFIGSGRLLERCKNLAQEIENKFSSTPTPKTYTFKSEVQHRELVDFYRSLDLFVLPSWFEGFGCVYTEAHSCGVPFIACEGQGIDDIIPVEDRDKWLCKQRDPEDLANKIANYIETRPKQKLKSEIYIQPLVEQFVKDLEKIQI